MRTGQSTVALLLLTGIITACASNTKERPIPPEAQQKMFQELTHKLDFDRDGTATCTDIEKARTHTFQSVDKNADSVLISSEYRLAKFEDRAYFFYEFNQLDTSNDHRISLNEYLSVPKSEFTAIDQDGDCTINQPEAVAYLKSTLRDRSKGDGKGRKNQSKNKGKRQPSRGQDDITIPPIEG